MLGLQFGICDFRSNSKGQVSEGNVYPCCNVCFAMGQELLKTMEEDMWSFHHERIGHNLNSLKGPTFGN